MRVQKLSVTVKKFMKEYVDNLHKALSAVKSEDVDGVVSLLVDTIEDGRRIFVCGNGGSAAISDHFMCDHSKCLYNDTHLIPQVHSLSSNMSLITAIGNDLSYEDIYSYQLSMFGGPGDTLVVVSSSGNSPNIIKALNTARALGMYTAALVGFNGGEAKNIADHVLHVPAHNYGIVEDSHQSLMHIIAQHIRVTYKNTNVDLKL